MSQYAMPPYSASTLHSTISELFVDPNTHTAKVQWSQGYAVRANRIECDDPGRAQVSTAPI